MAERVETLLARLTSGHVIITSRLADWSAGVRPLELDVLPPDTAAAFLLARTDDRRRPAGDDEQQARLLAGDLDGLALALEQSTAYIHQRRCSVAAYRELWRDRGAAVRGWSDARLTKYPHSVATTRLTTIGQLSPAAHDLLRALSYLAPAPIPQAVVSDDDDDAPLAELIAFSLARWDHQTAPPTPGVAAADDDTTRTVSYLRVHRLVQDVTHSRIADADRSVHIQRALNMVHAADPGNPEDVRTWPDWDALRPHATAAIESGDAAAIAKPTSTLMNDLGLLLAQKCLFGEAESLYRRALAMEEQGVAVSDQRVAGVERSERPAHDDYGGSRRSTPATHQVYVAIINNLASLLLATNRLAEAEALMRRALAIFRDSLGDEHPHTKVVAENLAALLAAMGAED